MRAIPATFPGFHRFHLGVNFLVCGCGRSLNELPTIDGAITIGVNDVGRLFQPDYLVVLNKRNQFSGDRFSYVESSRARALFTHLDLGIDYPHVVRFRLGQRGGTDLSDPETLPYARNSPYVALCLAAFMGAKRIGLIGVDFTDHHFFAKTGRHKLAGELDRIDREYRALNAAFVGQGIEVFNLSGSSRLTAFPKMAPQAFLEGEGRCERTNRAAGSLNIASYATTPVAGVPAILARCIDSRTSHRGQCVWASNNYGNGVKFNGGVQWRHSPRQAMEILDAADLVVVHNGKVAPEHRAMLEDKPVVTMAHNYMWNVGQYYVKKGLPGVVVGQYQATLPEFKDWQVVPNPLPFWESTYAEAVKNAEITICYTPSGKHEAYPQGHRLYWHGKGYRTTMDILDRLARRYPLRLEVIRNGQRSHEEVLAMKRHSHIVIDECVTGSYHRNSLEGLAMGCVVINGIGLLPGVEAALLHCAPGSQEIPFVSADLHTLESVLTELIERGSGALEEEGRGNRDWVAQHWEFSRQWGLVWQPVVECALQACHTGQPTDGIPMRVSSENLKIKRLSEHPEPMALTVVIPFGGIQRFPHLKTTVRGVQNSGEVEQIIIVEVGSQPIASAWCREIGVEYVFCRIDGEFDKVRAINIGSALARHKIILWCDGDLLFSEGFFANALKEFRSRALDFLYPFSRIEYLGEVDSTEVISGARLPQECQPTHVLKPVRGGAIGGVGLVRRDFLERYGGMVEGFLGWGGEDNAWYHKASLLGRVGTAKNREQIAWHLFHPDSGGIGAQPWRNNPNYGRNVELLTRIQKIRTPTEFLRQFPPIQSVPFSWPASLSLTFVVGEQKSIATRNAESAARWTKEVFGLNVQLLKCDFGTLDKASINSCSDLVVGFVDSASDSKAFSIAADGMRSLLVLGPDHPSTGSVEALTKVDWIIASNADQLGKLSSLGLHVWPFHMKEDGHGGGKTLFQALSHLAVDQVNPFPVWSYWEGAMPDWISACIDTIRHHVPMLHLLGPREFEALRGDIDRDIDLSRLHVAHRADYIRAFLLKHFGGLWIDADCIVLKNLGRLLAQLKDVDCIVHRERQGYFSNAFLAATPGGILARELYARVCQRLRSKRRLEWISLGNEPLSEVLQQLQGRYLELAAEQVQPVCWSRPERFFQQAVDAEHLRSLDAGAYCYMLSNQNVIRYQKENPSALLNAPSSFFNFLVRHALGKGDFAGEPKPMIRKDIERAFVRIRREHARQGQESIGGPGCSNKQTAQIRLLLPRLLRSLGTRVLVEFPCSDFHWMQKMSNCVDQYIGVDMQQGLVSQNKKRYEEPHRNFIPGTLFDGELPVADVVLCRDFLVHLPNDNVMDALRGFIASGSRYLLTTTFPGRGRQPDIRLGGWRPIDLEAPPFNLTSPMEIINERCSEGNGAFGDKSLALWDAKTLRSVLH